MKYNELVQIANFFQKYKKMDFLRRIDDNIFELCLDRQSFIIDLNRQQSGIYQGEIKPKFYNAPFDIMLKKLCGNALISKVCVSENNRILLFTLKLEKAYKSLETKLCFEFTGKNTNCILTDQNNIIIQALRHIQKSSRPIELSKPLMPLQSVEINEKNYEIIKNFTDYFHRKFNEIYENKLLSLRQNKLVLIQKKLSNLQTLLRNLENEKNLLTKADEMQGRAELLLANLYKIKDYERKFHLVNYEGKEFEFILEKAPKFAVNELFALAKKYKQKAKNLHLQRLNLEQKILDLEQVGELVQKANSSFELEILVPKKQSNKQKTKQGLAGIGEFFYNDFKILVGKNESGNEQILSLAKKDDLWFHIKDFPGSHALIVANKTPMNEALIEFAAKLCVYFSKLHKGVYLVDYTQRKFVKVQKNAFVHYSNFKSTHIKKE